MKKRLRKYILPLFIIFTLNELCTSVIRPMTLVYPLAYALSALEAVEVGELALVAMALFESKRQVNINHAATDAACSYIATKRESHPKEGAAITTIGRDYASYIWDVPEQEVIKAPAVVAAKPAVQKQIASKCVSNCTYSYIEPRYISYPSYATPITFTFDDTRYKPQTTYYENGFRTQLGNGYFEVRLTPSRIHVPKPKSVFEREQDFINKYWINDPDFEYDLREAFNHCLDVLIQTEKGAEYQKIEARLRCIDLRLPGMYGAYLQNTINALLSYYFRKDGSLVDLYSNEDFGYILYNKLLYPIYGQNVAIQILKKRGFPSTAYNIENPSYCSNISDAIFINSWLYSAYKIKETFYDRSPVDWKRAIRDNVTNQYLLELIDACKEHDWVIAEIFRDSHPKYSENIYQYYYRTYQHKTFNEYGIYRVVEWDPLWLRLPENEKNVIKTNQSKQQEWNTTLLMRLDWKKKLQDTWGIPDNAHHVVHKALYQLVGIHSTPELIDAIFGLITPENPNRNILVDAFINKYGILKDFRNLHTEVFRVDATLLSPELHVLCHQYNQMIYVYNIEKDATKKETIAQALKTFCSLIKENNVKIHQEAIQSTYAAVVTQLSTEAIAKQLERFKQNTILACEVPPKNKMPEISKCPKHEEDQPPLGCGQPEIPDPIITGGCLPEFPEPDIVRCPGVIGIDFDNTVTSCNWSKYQQLPGLLDTNPEGSSSEENQNDDEQNNNNEPATDDEITAEEDKVTPEQQHPKNKKPPKKGARSWDLPNHDPAIDIEKIDFSEVPYLTEAEIELVKECIKRFFGVEGLLANDGALWRILKYEDQKDGSLFELEYIIELSDQGRKIIKMGYEVKIQGDLIEIDIETDTELIECKSGVWEMKNEDKIERLKKKLLLGKEYGNDIQKPFVVVSKKPIPSIWKNWLDENNIKYRENQQ